jgi:hypothetical protein
LAIGIGLVGEIGIGSFDRKERMAWSRMGLWARPPPEESDRGRFGAWGLGVKMLPRESGVEGRRRAPLPMGWQGRRGGPWRAEAGGHRPHGMRGDVMRILHNY